MDPVKLLGLIANFAIFIPPPWGPLLAAIGKVLPLVEEGVTAAEAVAAADPTLVPHLQQAASQAGLSIDTVAKSLFAPQQLTASQLPYTGIRYHGGPKSP
jgi:hypothetical protein